MTDASVTWNDERVEQLRKLWAEGKSASQIAAEIGGVSRNAVIGKVHRLGLSGRPKAGGGSKTRQSTAQAGRGNAPAEAGAPAQSTRNASAPAPAAELQANSVPAREANAPGADRRAAGADNAGPGGVTPISRPATQADPGGDTVVEPAGAAGSEVDTLAFPERVTIMDLREGMCRWPIGDPTSPDFRFCGARSEIGTPYCEHHAQIAYQPAADRRREKKVARG